MSVGVDGGGALERGGDGEVCDVGARGGRRTVAERDQTERRMYLEECFLTRKNHSPLPDLSLGSLNKERSLTAYSPRA